jgi:hypothetical protein
MRDLLGSLRLVSFIENAAANRFHSARVMKMRGSRKPRASFRVALRQERCRWTEYPNSTSSRRVLAARSGSFSRDLDARCLLAFPQAREMHGVFDSKNVAATATPPNRWRDLRMCERHLLEAGDVAIICYRAAVTRADGQPYAALVSSGHVRRTDGCGSLANLPRGSLQTPHVWTALR